MANFIQSITALDSSPLAFLASHGYLFVYLGTVFFGEVVILSSFILAGQGVVNVWLVFVLAVLGTVTADAFWYCIGRISLTIFKRAVLSDPPTHAFTRLLHMLTGRYLLLTILGSKFIIGGRLLTVLYLARARVYFPLFAFFDAIGAMLFVAMLALFGWAAGNGISIFSPDHPVIGSIVAFIVLIALIALFERLLRRKLDRNSI